MIKTNLIKQNNQKISKGMKTEDFKHLKFDFFDNVHIVTLIDSSGYEILKGYGDSVVTAINDLHSNLL